ncbi:succinyl-diaminopimelate desuccinylase [Anaerolineae bacterium]|nr:succinyl-diaminopimelate desuccinylase [Anaerolineae bacterium]
MTVDIQAIYDHMRAHKSKHTARIIEFLRQPSVSAGDSTQMRRCAELLQQYFQELGCVETELVETDGHPGVWAYYNAGAKRTIVNYCMYDTQPVREEEAWSFPPFDARLASGTLIGRPEFDSVIIARGAIKTKAPLRAWLNALEAIIAVEGKLPVNIMFIAEGEEELGSPHLDQIVDKYYDRLRNADAVLQIDAAQNREGKVELSLGCKGNIYFDVECSSESWGRGSRRDVHSSLRPIVDNPALRLIQAVSTMIAPDGYSPNIEGLSDDIEPWAEDHELIKALARDPDFLREMAEEYEIIRWINGMTDPEDLLYRYFYGPNLNVNGINSGYAGPGAETVIPHRAVCKVNIRLVPNQEPDSVMEKVRTHLDKQGFSDISLKAPKGSKLEGRDYAGYTWSKTSMSADLVQAVLKTYQDRGVHVSIKPHSPESSPMYLFSRPPLNLPVCSGGLGHGARAHSADEYFVVDGHGKVAGLLECEKSYVEILYNFAEN